MDAVEPGQMTSESLGLLRPTSIVVDAPPKRPVDGDAVAASDETSTPSTKHKMPSFSMPKIQPGALKGAGAALQRPTDIHAAQPPEPSQHDGAAMDVEVDEGAGQPIVPIEPEPADHEGNVIDTTAELLGRAKPRRPRAKAPAITTLRKSTRAAGSAGRKPPARRAARSKKAAADPGDDN